MADDPGRIMAYHRVLLVPPDLGEPAKPWHNQTLVFCGNREGTQVPASLVVPVTAFHHSTGNNAVLQVPTAASLLQLMAATPDSSLFGPFAAGDVDTEGVTVGRIMYCPNSYVSLFGEAGVSPRVAYEFVTARITADNLGTNLEVLERWLRATCTHTEAQEILHPWPFHTLSRSRCLIRPRHQVDSIADSPDTIPPALPNELAPRLHTPVAGLC